jgi:signal transduction histidine kinase
MLENLLHNAIRHSPSDTTIDLRITCTESEATVTIRDCGPGISQSQLATIFDRFHQFDPGRKRAGATGLGLAIVKAVAELHGGQVSVRNQPDAGCEFAVTLPLSCPVPSGV